MKYGRATKVDFLQMLVQIGYSMVFGATQVSGTQVFGGALQNLIPKNCFTGTSIIKTPLSLDITKINSTDLV
jgi:hypothetical protein